MRGTRGKIDRLKMVIRKEVITKSRVQNLGERTWEKKRNLFSLFTQGLGKMCDFIFLSFLDCFLEKHTS